MQLLVEIMGSCQLSVVCFLLSSVEFFHEEEPQEIIHATGEFVETRTDGSLLNDPT